MDTLGFEFVEYMNLKLRLQPFSYLLSRWNRFNLIKPKHEMELLDRNAT